MARLWFRIRFCWRWLILAWVASGVALERNDDDAI